MGTDSAVKAYGKPPLPLAEQVAKLQSRGMVIDDVAFAERYLGAVNYYRFVGYGLPFEEWGSARERLDRYRNGTRFEDVVALCSFDSELRSLLWHYLESVEVSFRTALCYVMSNDGNDPFWCEKQSLFDRQADHAEFLGICRAEFDRDKSEFFIHNYKNKYGNRRLPPCWILIEIVPFGAWSKTYQNLRHGKLKKRIAGHMGTNARYLESWIHAVVVTRNLCAHHLRIWNKVMPKQPSLSPKMRDDVADHRLIGAVIITMRELLKPQGKGQKFMDQVNALLGRYPMIDRNEIGLV